MRSIGRVVRTIRSILIKIQQLRSVYLENPSTANSFFSKSTNCNIFAQKTLGFRIKLFAVGGFSLGGVAMMCCKQKKGA